MKTTFLGLLFGSLQMFGSNFQLSAVLGVVFSWQTNKKANIIAVIPVISQKIRELQTFTKKN